MLIPSAANDRGRFIKLAQFQMPFGKYMGWRLMDLPERYLVWFRQKGFPKGEIGEMLEAVLEIKTNGLEYLFEPLRGTAEAKKML